MHHYLGLGNKGPESSGFSRPKELQDRCQGSACSPWLLWGEVCASCCSITRVYTPWSGTRCVFMHTKQNLMLGAAISRLLEVLEVRGSLFFFLKRKRVREKKWFVVSLIYAFIEWFLCVPWHWGWNSQPWYIGTTHWTTELPSQGQRQSWIHLWNSVLTCSTGTFIMSMLNKWIIIEYLT